MDAIIGGPLYRNTMSTVESAGKLININSNVMERLRAPRRALIVSVPVRMDDDRVRNFTGFRVQHNQTLGPFKGGLRFHPDVNLSETAALSALMTFKNSLLNLPLGGAKGGVQVDPTSLSKKELEHLTRRFTSEIAAIIGPDKDIPAPDVGTNSQTMAWIMDTFSIESGYSQTGVVTGKPIEIGGSQGRDSATGLGVIYTTEKALEANGKNIRGASLAIQGFGKVGMHAAKEGYDMGAKIVAVSDVDGGIFNGDGIDVPDLIQYIKESGSIKGYPKAEILNNKELLTLDVDVLIPCALDAVINEDNAKDIRAGIIVEGANGPTTIFADQLLYEKGIMVVPDILANGGGVVVSYFEWVQDIVWLFWSEDEVRAKLAEIMYRSFERVHAFSVEHGKSMRTAAMATSLRRLERAMLLRGQAW